MDTQEFIRNLTTVEIGIARMAKYPGIYHDEIFARVKKKYKSRYSILAIATVIKTLTNAGIWRHYYTDSRPGVKFYELLFNL